MVGLQTTGIRRQLAGVVSFRQPHISGTHLSRLNYNVQLIEAAALASLFLLCGCRSSHITDEKLVVVSTAIVNSSTNLPRFPLPGTWSLLIHLNRAVASPEGSEPVFADLKRRTGFIDAQMYVKAGPPRTLWVPVELRGTLSTSSSVVGYVYSQSALTPLAGIVWQDVEDKTAYKRIAVNWYIFVTN